MSGDTGCGLPHHLASLYPPHPHSLGAGEENCHLTDATSCNHSKNKGKRNHPLCPMKRLGNNAGESLRRRSWEAFRLHLPNTRKMKERANIAGSVVLVPDLLLINTSSHQIPLTSARVLIPRRAGASKMIAEIWLPSHGQRPRPGIFHSSLDGARTRSFPRRCPLLPAVELLPGKRRQNTWICSCSKAFDCVYLLESSSGLGYWNCFHQTK